MADMTADPGRGEQNAVCSPVNILPLSAILRSVRSLQILADTGRATFHWGSRLTLFIHSVLFSQTQSTQGNSGVRRDRVIASYVTTTYYYWYSTMLRCCWCDERKLDTGERDGEMGRAADGCELSKGCGVKNIVEDEVRTMTMTMQIQMRETSEDE